MKASAVIFQLFAIFWIGSASAVEILGNRVFSDRELVGSIDLSAPDDSIASAISDIYRAAGYYNVEIEISPESSVGKEISIAEGHPTRIESLVVDAVPPIKGIGFDDLIEDALRNPASEANLNNFAESAIARMAEAGRPYASGQWRDFELTPEGDLNAVFRILPGPKGFVAGSKFSGIKRTRPAYLRRKLAYHVGGTFSETKIIESERAINRLPYVDIAAPYDIEPFADGESLYVVHNVAELPSTRFDGAAGVANSSGKDVFLGRLDVEFGDIVGTGRAFGLRWNRKDRWSNELALRYLEPYALGSLFDFIAEASQADQDTLFIKTSFTAGLRREFQSGLTAGVGVGLERTVPEQAPEITRSTARFARVAFGFDSTDQPDNPRIGYAISSTLNYRLRHNAEDSISADLAERITSAGMRLWYYKAFTRRFVVAISAGGWGIISEDGRVAVDELAFLGGPDNLRGYMERRFPAYRYALGVIEPRLLTGKGSRIYAFLDLAQIKSSQTSSSDYTFYPGFGAGAVAPSALGQFKIEIGWGKTGFPDEGVLNFGLAGQF
jgi:outer membrane protein assembly factor BamA